MGADEVEVLSWLAGDQIIPLRSDEPGNVDGYIYPLNSQASRNRYKTTLYLLKLIGISRIINDFAGSARASGTKTAQNLGPIQTGLFTAGAITPIRTLSAEQQRLRALIAQTKEGKELLKDVEDALRNDALLKAPEAAEELKQAKEEIKQGKAERARAQENLETPEQEIIRLGNEINRLDRAIKADPTSLETLLPQIEAKVKRIEELEKLL